MRKLYKEDTGNAKMIGMIIGMLVTIVISVLIVYNMAGSVDVDSVDSKIEENVFGNTTGGTNIHYAGNSTTDITDNANTFYVIAPIVAVVAIAVAIIGYVYKMG